MMSEMPDLKPGLKLEKIFYVGEEYTAKFLGSGEVSVLSTPSMIAFMENTARLAVEPYLPEGCITVGTMVHVKHVAPAPRGSSIRVQTVLRKIEGRKLVFEVKAFWRGKVIGEGVHERYIVDRERFLGKVKNLL